MRVERPELRGYPRRLKWLPLPLGEGWGEGNNHEICWPHPLTLTLSQGERDFSDSL